VFHGSAARWGYEAAPRWAIIPPLAGIDAAYAFTHPVNRCSEGARGASRARRCKGW
jgi:hypothetical protein